MISDAARPLPPRDRQAFVRAVTEALRGIERGPGVVHRIAREMQARYRDPPLEADGERR
jgi:hypothetical protein